MCVCVYMCVFNKHGKKVSHKPNINPYGKIVKNVMALMLYIKIQLD